MSELINKLNEYRSMGDKFYPEDIVVTEDIWALIDEIERLNNIINKALRKLRASKDHFKTENENNAVTFTIKILEEVNNND